MAAVVPLPLCVFKVGGSLLDLPHLPEVLADLRAQRAGAQTVWIAGGGSAADVVREWDRIHHLGEGRAHQLALESLRLTEALLHQLLAPSIRVTRREHLPANEGAWAIVSCRDALAVLDAERGARTAAGPARDLVLPHSWDATTDAIAAWIALHWQAAELVLVKSIPAPSEASAEAAAGQGWVDRCFPRLATHLPAVSWVDARQAPHRPSVGRPAPRSAPAIQPWLRAGQPVPT